jgi:hypothetical protein
MLDCLNFVLQMFVHPLDLTSIVFHIFALFNAVKEFA